MTTIHATTIFQRASFSTAHVYLADQYSSTEADATWIKEGSKSFLASSSDLTRYYL
ncbi:MAG TPA: hypothetical protein VI386_11575 [Candidatus Sulfotelmatobacter sp.]